MTQVTAKPENKSSPCSDHLQTALALHLPIFYGDKRSSGKENHDLITLNRSPVNHTANPDSPFAPARSHATCRSQAQIFVLSLRLNVARLPTLHVKATQKKRPTQALRAVGLPPSNAVSTRNSGLAASAPRPAPAAVPAWRHCNARRQRAAKSHWLCVCACKNSGRASPLEREVSAHYRYVKCNPSTPKCSPLGQKWLTAAVRRSYRFPPRSVL